MENYYKLMTSNMQTEVGGIQGKSHPGCDKL